MVLFGTQLCFVFIIFHILNIFLLENNCFPLTSQLTQMTSKIFSKSFITMHKDYYQKKAYIHT